MIKSNKIKSKSKKSNNNKRNGNSTISSNSTTTRNTGPKVSNTIRSKNNTMIFSNKEMVRTIESDTNDFQLVYNEYINAGMISFLPFGSQIFKNFDKFRIKGLKLIFSTASGTNVNASFAMAFEADPVDSPPTSLIDMSIMKKYVMCPVSKNCVLDISNVVSKKWYKVTDDIVHILAEKISINDYFPGKLYIGVEGTTIAVGHLNIEYEIEVDSPSRAQDLSTSAYTVLLADELGTTSNTSPYSNHTNNTICFGFSNIGLNAAGDTSFVNRNLDDQGGVITPESVHDTRAYSWRHKLIGTYRITFNWTSNTALGYYINNLKYGIMRSNVSTQYNPTAAIAGVDWFLVASENSPQSSIDTESMSMVMMYYVSSGELLQYYNVFMDYTLSGSDHLTFDGSYKAQVQVAFVGTKDQSPQNFTSSV